MQIVRVDEFTQVRTVAITEPLIEGIHTAEEFIAFAARVSNPSNQLNTETGPRLLSYLIRHKHWSPFEMAHAVVEIKTTRDIGRQILRHRSFAFQEFSQRYAESQEFAIREARLQDNKNRQNSLETADQSLKDWWEDTQKHVAMLSVGLYREALSRGIAKEQARALLPEGITGSTLYMAGSIRSFIHYLDVRTHESTQKEHRDIAKLVQDALVPYVPSLALLGIGE
jgi:thymidylate synthase (FAD)